ncbi:unnamed protein product, partial [Mycena citricolor]
MSAILIASLPKCPCSAWVIPAFATASSLVMHSRFVLARTPDPPKIQSFPSWMKYLLALCRARRRRSEFPLPSSSSSASMTSKNSGSCANRARNAAVPSGIAMTTTPVSQPVDWSAAVSATLNTSATMPVRASKSGLTVHSLPSPGRLPSPSYCRLMMSAATLDVPLMCFTATMLWPNMPSCHRMCAAVNLPPAMTSRIARQSVSTITGEPYITSSNWSKPNFMA